MALIKQSYTPIISLRSIGIGATLEQSMIEFTSLRRETYNLLPSEKVIHEHLVSCCAKAFSYDDVVWPRKIEEEYND